MSVTSPSARELGSMCMLQLHWQQMRRTLTHSLLPVLAWASVESHIKGKKHYLEIPKCHSSWHNVMGFCVVTASWTSGNCKMVMREGFLLWLLSHLPSNHLHGLCLTRDKGDPFAHVNWPKDCVGLYVNVSPSFASWATKTMETLIYA